MRHMLCAGAIVPALLIAAQAAQPAHAQGFLKRFAERALEKAERHAKGAAEGGGEVEAGPRPDRKVRQQAESAPAAMTPRAIRSAAPSEAAPRATAPEAAARYTDDIAKSAEAERLRLAYNAFGEVRCSDCEGGIDFDGRPKFEYDSRFSGQYNERAWRIGNGPVGHVHRWQGKASSGTLTVVAEETLDGLRCRRALYKLVRGKASAERPSLVCWGLANRSSSVENWHEIY